MKDKRLLYFSRFMGLGGTEKVVLELVETFKGEFKEVMVCSAGGIYEKRLEELGVNHIKINDIDNKSIFNILNILNILLKLIDNYNIDVIHTHHRMAAFYVSIIKKLRNVEFIHTAHNTFTDKKFLTNFALKKAHIIAVGNEVKNNLCDLYNIDKRNISVIFNGIEKKEFTRKSIPEFEIARKKNEFIVCNIGRLSEQKGMKYFIESACYISKVTDKIKFFIIGDGEEKQNLKNLVEKLNLEKKISFLGYREDIFNIISQSDLIVLSSLWEGLPLTPIETFAVQKTIIATNVDGTPEIVKNNYNGILVRPRNSKDISKAILKLYNNNNLLKNLEMNAYKTYSENFDIKKFRNNYLEYYKRVIF
ncbi:glycosyltransferase family 4 protein [Clostridium perfringens]|nr:glycosyltransferase family 4 protein [Clostridium perfringens]EHK2442949.1 glycosyltransferase family 4 protein [Clostridium perfringens]